MEVNASYFTGEHWCCVKLQKYEFYLQSTDNQRVMTVLEGYVPC